MNASLKKQIKGLRASQAKAAKKGQLAEEAKICNALGDLYLRHGMYPEAAEEHERELALCVAIPALPLDLAVAHRRLGECLCELGHYGKARDHQLQHLCISKEQQSDVEEQRALATLGRTELVHAQSLVDKGRLAEAEDHLLESQQAFLDALEVCDRLRGKLPDRDILDMRARLYLNLALVREGSTEDEKRNQAFLNKALVISRDQNHKETELMVRIAFAQFLRGQDQLRTALRHLNVAVQLAEDVGEPLKQAESLEMMAEMFLLLGEFTDSKLILKRVHRLGVLGDHEQQMVWRKLCRVTKITRRQGELECLRCRQCVCDEDIASLLEKLGDSCCAVEAYKQAIEYYTEQLALCRRSGVAENKLASVLVSLAATYSDVKDYNKAIEFFQQEMALHEGEHRELCNSGCNIARLQLLVGRQSEALLTYERALEDAQCSGSASLQVTVLQAIEKVYRSEGRHAEAERAVSEAATLEVVEEMSADPDSDSADSELSDVELSPSEDDLDEESDNEKSVVKTVRTGRAVPARVDKVNHKGETALQRAAIAGNATLVQNLLKMGAKVRTRDHFGWTPLHEAANHGHLKIVELLADHGADVNDPGGRNCEGITPLHDAVTNGHISVVKLLLNLHADVNAADSKGRTPLDYAVDQRCTFAGDSRRGSTSEAAVFVELESLLRDHGGRCGRENGRSPPDCAPMALVRSQNSPVQIRADHRTPSKKKRSRTAENDSSPSPPPVNRRKGRLKPSAKKRCRPSARLAFDSDEAETGATLSSGTSDMSDFDDDSLVTLTGVPLAHSVSGPVMTGSETEAMSDDQNENGLAVLSSPGSPVSSTFQPLNFERRFSPGKSALPSRSSFRDGSESRCPLVRRRSREIGALLQDEDGFVAGDDDWLIDDLPTPASGARRLTSSANSTLSGRRERVHQHSRRAESTEHLRGDESAVESRNNYRATTSNHRETLQTSVPSTFRVQVCVEDITFVVVCPSELPGGEPPTMAWLAEQASERYFREKGVRLLLQLATEHGALFSSQDAVVSLLNNGETVHGHLVEIDLPPLPQRYRDVCQSLKVDPIPSILQVLSEQPQTIDLTDMALSASDCRCLFRAIQRQVSLTRFVLAANVLGDAGVLHLVQALPCLPGLRSLDLSLNGLTAMSITHLFGTTKAVLPSLSKRHLLADHRCSSASPWTLCLLEELDLSHNLLTGRCTGDLVDLLQKMPFLQKISLASCGLLAGSVRILGVAFSCLPHLVKLDISHNTIDVAGVKDLFSSLPQAVLTSLLLSGCVSQSVPGEVGHLVSEYLKKPGCTLQVLCLSSCALYNDDVEHISVAASAHHSLIDLDLSANFISWQGLPQLSRLAEGCGLQRLVLAGNNMLGERGCMELVSVACGSGNVSLRRLDLASCGLESPLARQVLRISLVHAVSSEDSSDWTSSGTPTTLSGALVELELSFNDLSVCDKEELSHSWQALVAPRTTACQLDGSLCRFTVI